MSNPTFSPQDAEKMARSRGCTDKVMVIGFRSATSKYGEYDDTLAILTPDSYNEYRGNTLPSTNKPNLAVLEEGDYKYIPGLHGIHHLNLAKDATDKWVSEKDGGIYTWLLGHKGQDYPEIVKDADGNVRLIPYWACRQHGPVRIKRIGASVAVWDGWPGNPAWIDIHKGGWNLTSSEGCQTDFPDHWPQFRGLLYSELEKYGQETFMYGLHDLAA